MKKNRKFQLLVFITFITFTLVQCISLEDESQSNYDLIKSDFLIPSEDNTVWCYWYWIGDDISKEGITKDLEAMKEVGIGGAFIGNINPGGKDGKVPMLSENWWDHMVHAVNEAKRIGVDIGVFNCPGWSQSGGPWVKPDMAMRYVTYSEVKVEGGKNLELKLIKPKAVFQDTHVIAFPTIFTEQNTLSIRNATIQVEPNIKDPINLIDKDTTTFASFSNTNKEYNIDISGNKAITARSLRIIPSNDVFKINCEVLAKINGEYKTIKSFTIDRSKLTPNVGPDKYAPILQALPETKASSFRLKINLLGDNIEVPASSNVKSRNWKLVEISVSEAVGLEAYAQKTLGKMHPTPFPEWDSYKWEKQENISDDSLIVNADNIINISDKMDVNGNLSWDAPEGKWTIQRYGMTPTGTKNSPAAPQGTGYEVDKANKEHVQFHYDHFIGELLKRIPEESKSAFKYVIADSYEMGSQNWTDGFEEKFKEKFGYNPEKFLPVFSGRIVGSVEESERFLWDLRRFIADAVAYEYVGGLAEASNDDNLQLWLENYGHWGFPSEFLMYGGQSNLVSGEFWNEGTLGDIECKSASSAAHIYGKNKVYAEGFTASKRTYVRHPAMLKKRGDWSFTEGVNHLVLHVNIHQPDDDRVPGINAWFSTEFNRHNTWFKKGKTYFDYLRRSQHLLQQGLYAADVCYFIGEDAPIMTGARRPELPDGYAYDYINAEVILNRLSVKDGKFVLPDGMTYSLMVLPPFDTMRPELLEKIEQLVSQGGKIYGQSPLKSPSLQNYPESDDKVKRLASKMWDTTNDSLKKYGQGTIVDGLGLQDALSQLKIDKDVDVKEQDSILWTHRTMPGMDLYFLTNQSHKVINFEPSFRVSGKKPQLWDAVTGDIRNLNEFTENDGRISLPVKMEPLQSWFIVITNDQIDSNKSYTKNFPGYKTLKTLENPWRVDFQNKNIGPEKTVDFPVLTDWIENENDSIKYYSGNAVYKSTFNFVEDEKAKDIFIDLGAVGVMATVKINNIDIGTTWIYPFRLEATEAIQEGENTIEVEVVNVWRNRITGDKQLPKEKRSTWLLTDSTTPEEELITSGLLGPVKLQTINTN